MSKAQITRDHILKQAAAVFNQRGFQGASISDIMEATRLKKGGIYNHFQSKDELALAAFDYAINQIRQRYVVALRGQHNAVDQLRAVIDTFCSTAQHPPIQGGCPLLNTAIESDDTHPELRLRAQQAMLRWQKMIHKIVESGQQQGQLKTEADPAATATVIIASLEGALMMSQLYGDPMHLNRVQSHLHSYISATARS